jgi:site-specific DNA-methyltransferase (adenine-specific)
MKPYYSDDSCTIYHGDCREVLPALYPEPGWGVSECVIADPPWDEPDLFGWLNETVAARIESLLVFTDARRIGEPIETFGAPDWLFVWDTMNTWSQSPRQPVQQTKLCLWYGEHYDRDAELWGDAPPVRDHPTTKQTPLDGRRLTDLYRESLRWLHNPSAGTGSAGTERFNQRQSEPAMRHAKPVGWLRCLIGNTSTGDVIDPFMGSGTTLRAAKDLGRKSIGIEIDERCCEIAVARLAQEVLAL